MKLFYLPRSCLHTETDKGWTEGMGGEGVMARWRGGYRFPYSKSTYPMYVFANPHPAAAACRFPAKFSGDPGNCEKRQEGEEGSRAPNGGEKRRSLITPVRSR